MKSSVRRNRTSDVRAGRGAVVEREPAAPGWSRRAIVRGLGAAPIALALSACGDERGRGSGVSGAGTRFPGDAGSVRPPAAPAIDGGEGGVDAGLDRSDAGGDLVDAGDGDRGDSGEDASETCAPTSPDVRGPFYRQGAPNRATLVGPDEPGEPLEIQGSVVDLGCRAIAGAVLDVWHADAAGRYDNDSADYRLRGILMSGADGAFSFQSVRPGNYPDANGMRPAHVHFTVTHPGHRSITTQLYFRGDPFLSPNDSCGICNSGDETLVIDLVPELRGGVRWWKGRFEIVLRPA